MNAEMVPTNLDKKIRIIFSRVAGVCLASFTFWQLCGGGLFLLHFDEIIYCDNLIIFVSRLYKVSTIHHHLELQAITL